MNRVSQLSSELEDAHRTMAALENINVSTLPSTGRPRTLTHTGNILLDIWSAGVEVTDIKF